MYTDQEIAPAEHMAWYERLQGDDSRRCYLFEYRERPAGLVQFTRINRNQGTCDWGFYLGNDDLPPGTGSVMGRMALEILFEQEKLRKVYGEAFSFNKASIRFHEKMGFTQEGLLRQHVTKHGEYQDVLLFGLLREEFMGKWSEAK
jgi:UDP-4-amino-4,6-dideoxy-N-acetyl-beta-L-altrosamine N-acetyltransferase